MGRELITVPTRVGFFPWEQAFIGNNYRKVSISKALQTAACEAVLVCQMFLYKKSNGL
jgi:hypothetical protein